jgi:hypothetical protein
MINPRMLSVVNGTHMSCNDRDEFDDEAAAAPDEWEEFRSVL